MRREGERPVISSRKRMLMNEQGAGAMGKDSSWEAVRHGITVGGGGRVDAWKVVTILHIYGEMS